MCQCRPSRGLYLPSSSKKTSINSWLNRIERTSQSIISRHPLQSIDHRCLFIEEIPILCSLETDCLYGYGCYSAVALLCVSLAQCVRYSNFSAANPAFLVYPPVPVHFPHLMVCSPAQHTFRGMRRNFIYIHFLTIHAPPPAHPRGTVGPSDCIAATNQPGEIVSVECSCACVRDLLRPVLCTRWPPRTCWWWLFGLWRSTTPPVANHPSIHHCHCHRHRPSRLANVK